MSKQHERSVGSNINQTRLGTMLLSSWAECKYCGLVASVVHRIPVDGSPSTNMRVVEEGKIVEDYDLDLDGFVSLIEIANSELDQHGCVPGSPFSARVRAMIEGVEE